MCDVVSKTLLKNPLFSQKTHCFQTCALFYPIVLKRKIITAGSIQVHVDIKILNEISLQIE